MYAFCDDTPQITVTVSNSWFVSCSKSLCVRPRRHAQSSPSQFAELSGFHAPSDRPCLPCVQRCTGEESRNHGGTKPSKSTPTLCSPCVLAVSLLHTVTVYHYRKPWPPIDTELRALLHCISMHFCSRFWGLNIHIHWTGTLFLSGIATQYVSFV